MSAEREAGQSKKDGLYGDWEIDSFGAKITVNNHKSHKEIRIRHRKKEL